MPPTSHHISKRMNDRPFDLHLFIAVSRSHSQCFLVLVIITYLFGSTVRCKFFSIFFSFLFSNLKFRSHRYNCLLQNRKKQTKPKQSKKHKKSVGCWLHYKFNVFLAQTVEIFLFCCCCCCCRCCCCCWVFIV